MYTVGNIPTVDLPCVTWPIVPRLVVAYQTVIRVLIKQISTHLILDYFWGIGGELGDIDLGLAKFSHVQRSRDVSILLWSRVTVACKHDHDKDDAGDDGGELPTTRDFHVANWSRSSMTCTRLFTTRTNQATTRHIPRMTGTAQTTPSTMALREYFLSDFSSWAEFWLVKTRASISLSPCCSSLSSVYISSTTDITLSATEPSDSPSPPPTRPLSTGAL